MLHRLIFLTAIIQEFRVIIVTDDSDITEPDDLKGKKIGVQQGTTGDIYSTDDFGDDNVERFNKGMEAVQALQQGKIDAVIIDNQPAKTFVEENEGLKILETSYVKKIMHWQSKR